MDEFAAGWMPDWAFKHEGGGMCPSDMATLEGA